MVDPSERISDSEREATVALLRSHLLAGRLTLDEFSERVEQAYGARVSTDLAILKNDLPEPASTPNVTARRKPTRLTMACFGHAIKRGRLRIQRRSVVLSLISGIDLDLRAAEIEYPRAVMTVLAMLGNVDIYLPEEVNVEVGGVTIVGHHRDWGRETGHSEAPTIRVRSLNLFGTVDVWRVPSDMRGDYRKITRRLQRRQGQLQP
ncbi:MAG: DUF1707 and DUF2154 domain-containing protein [Acidimicrobiaceae bacterium]|nr:DUF1707 and DUF2154 domain-containing protein [Acidimicrobiaceae bacterium]